MMFFVFYFIFGLIVGSFLNAVIFRLYKKESFVSGRSHCVYCGHELSALDLIPVLSFIFLRGKCRYCGKKLSWQYPLVEIITGLSFAGLAWQLNWEPGWFLVRNLFLGGTLILVAVYDFKHFIILDKVILPASIVALLSNILIDYGMGCNYFSLNCYTAGGLIAGLIIFGFFLLQYVVSKGTWIGFGDVKLAWLLGFTLGWPLALIGLFLSYISGAVVGVGLIAAGKKHMSSRLPFGTFLSFSAILTILFGPAILNWYLRLLGF